MRHIKSWIIGAALALGLAASAQAQQAPPNQPTAPDPSTPMKDQQGEQASG
jgi:hypothetical protein